MKSVSPASTSSGREVHLQWGGRFAGDRDVDWHTHAETELVVITAGRCRIAVGSHDFEGEKGTLFVLPAGEPQYQHTLGPVRTTFVGFSFPPGWFDESPRKLALTADEPILHWIEQLCDWPQIQPPLGGDMARQLLALVLRRIGELDALSGAHARQHPAVLRATRHLEEKMHEPIQLVELARLCGVSASHLVALFAEHCGCGPMTYLQQRRMERAAWLLANPYLRIQEVAVACGYSDVNYFVRLFKRQFGQPPGRWRKARFNPPKAS